MQNHTREWVSHEEIHAGLRVYAHRRMLAEPPNTNDLEVAAHLMECPACRADFDDLLAVTRHANASGAPALACPHPKGGQMLHPWRRKDDASPWRVDRSGRLWLAFSAALVRSWRLSPQLGAARGDQISRYEWGAADDEPALTIEVLAESDPAMVLVCLTLDVPGRNALDQSGVAVTLYEGSNMRQATTDTSGTVRFPQVPLAALGGLRFQVTVLGSKTQEL